MKQLGTTLLLFFWLNSHAQQRSLCQLFVNGYNQATENFSFLRPQPFDSTGSNDISKDTLALYGLDGGFIHQFRRVKSNKFSGYTYTEWFLYLRGPGQFKDATSFDEIKQNVSETFTEFCKGYLQGCLPTLKMTEIYTDTQDPEDDNINIHSCYFYFNEVSVPGGATLEEAKNIIDEVPYIEVAFHKRLFRKGYEMTFTIHGIKYNKP